jgi:hypothetical protein
VPSRFRQEVLNVLLAQLLAERGVVAAPESVITAPATKSKNMPDVIVAYQGLRTCIEGEIGYRKQARQLALESVKSRVEKNIATIGVAVVYPKELRSGDDIVSLKVALSEASLEISVVTEAGPTDFVRGNVDVLERILRDAFDHLVQEDVVARSVALIDGAIERFAGVMSSKKGGVERAAKALGIEALDEAATEKQGE